MEANYNSFENFSDETDMNNIISINSSEDIDDLQDFDFDYDPNEMYYALAKEENN